VRPEELYPAHRHLAVGVGSDPALDEVLVGYAHTLRDVLAVEFVGLYPLGSLAIGDFDLSSDVDFVVVVADEVNDEEVELVQAAYTDLIG
jgi:predicted nucleotidyltransferase